MELKPLMLIFNTLLHSLAFTHVRNAERQWSGQSLVLWSLTRGC